MCPGTVKPSQPEQKKPKKPIVHKKYTNPKALIIRDGKCYTYEQYYGKDPSEQNTNKNRN